MTWGVWGHKLDTHAIQGLIEECLGLGITTFDHADIYGHYTTEADFGKALAAAPHLRDQMQLVTKCGIRLVTPNRPENRLKSYDTSKSYIVQSVEQSLSNLKTDRIDLLLIHRPDPLLEPEEVAEAFTQLQQAGKVLHVGVSNFLPQQFDLLNSYIPLCTNQIQLSLLHSDAFLDGEIEHWMGHSIRPMAWSPIGGGALFSAEGKETNRELWKVIDRLSTKYEASTDQVLLAWLMRHPAGILPVLGTAKVHRLAAAAQATRIQLDRSDWFALWEGARGEEVA